MSDAHPSASSSASRPLQEAGKVWSRNCKCRRRAGRRCDSRLGRRTVNTARPPSRLQAGRGAVRDRARAWLRELAEVCPTHRRAARARSTVSRFEAAVDAIVAGDADTLARLLRERRIARPRALDARTSIDAAALRVGERRRGFSSEDAAEIVRDRADAARCRRRRERGIGGLRRPLHDARPDGHERASGESPACRTS